MKFALFWVIPQRAVVIHYRYMVKVNWSRYRPGVAQRVGRSIALLFHDRDTRRGWVVNTTPRPHFTSGKDAVPIVQEAGWAPGPVWTGGKSCPHRDSIPDRPALRQSLYRLSYRAHITAVRRGNNPEERRPHCVNCISNLPSYAIARSSAGYYFNLLAPELFFSILAHLVYKMWIIQEPNTLELWNKLHFEEKKTESLYHVL